MNVAVARKPVEHPCPQSAALPVNKGVRQAGFPDNIMTLWVHQLSGNPACQQRR